MKKILVTLLAGLMASSLMACGSSNSGTTTAATTEAPATTSASGTTQDASVEDPYANLQPLKLSAGHTGTTESMNQFIGEQMKVRLEERSNGKITLDIYPNSQLGSDKDMLTSNKAGDISFQIASTGVLVNDIPAANIIDIPFLFDSVDEACQVLEDETFYQLFCREFENAGFKLVMTAPQGFRCLTTNKAIGSADDLKGMTIRTMDNANHIAFWNDLGVNATPLAFSEVYMSLQQGLLDGQENPYQTIYANKLYEVQKYVTNSNHIFQYNTVTMGLSTFEGLDPAYQELIQEVMAEVSVLANEEAKRTDKEFLDKVVAGGSEFIDFDQISGMREALKEKTADAASRLEGVVPQDLLDAYLKAAETK